MSIKRAEELAVVVTSHPDDISALAAGVPGVRIGVRRPTISDAVTCAVELEPASRPSV